ncbi:hypothetical protein [Brevibacillus migulae]|uniref:hypothetical protein n=1 Tax=Brevibacillus migulae TaxID=1644114 RepID=UPI00106E3265|nr:hypothetical protein [Brevibacillus migulae]
MIPKKKWLSLLPMLAVLVGVEVYLYAQHTATVTQSQPVEQVSPVSEKAKPTLQVSHTLHDGDLHLQLTVTSFRFSLENMGKENRDGEGHVHLYLDDKKVAKIFDNNYIYKDIPKGKHQVVVELAHNNHDSYGVKQSFAIEVK